MPLGSDGDVAPRFAVFSSPISLWPGRKQVKRQAFQAFRLFSPGPAIDTTVSHSAGLPTVSNTHQVAQSIAPESRIVYLDNDPLVLSHARALERLTKSPRYRPLLPGVPA